MGKCKYCGQDAGFFHSKHAACKQHHLNGIARIKGIPATCFQHKEDFHLHQNEIQTICRDDFVSEDICRKIYCESFDAAIEQYLDDGIIDQNEERSVARFIQFTGVTQQVLNANKSLEKVVQSKVLQEILNGQIPTPRITISRSFPFLLNKNEHMPGLFRDVTLQMQKVRRETVGRTRGVSLSLYPYCNGLGRQKDGVNDKPMFFENLNSWFSYNVISNLK